MGIKKKIPFFLFVLLPLASILFLRLYVASREASILERVSFRVGEEQISIWSDGGAHYVFLPSHTQDIIEILLPDGISADLGGQEGIRGVGQCRIAPGEMQIVVFRDARGREVERASLCFMKSSGVPSAFLHTLDGGPERVHARKEHKEEQSAVRFLRADGTEEFSGGLAYLKGRGNSTWIASEKRPYSLTFAQPVDLFGMSGSRQWALLANSMDDSMIRNTLVYDAAHAAGIRFTPGTQFMDLYINGEYRGLYQLTGRPQVSPSRVDIIDLQGRTEALNRAELSSFPPIFIGEGPGSRKAFNIPYEPEDITGGYLLMGSQFIDRYNEETSGFITDNGIPIVVKSPEYTSGGQIEYISGIVQAMEDALYDGITGKAAGEKPLGEHIDMESWVKTYLLEEVFMDVDAGMTDQYFYKDADTAGGLLCAGVVWDFDLTMGNTLPTRNPETLYAARADQFPHLPDYNWFERLYANEEFYSMLVTEYEKVFRPLLVEIIQSGADGLLAEIEASAHMDDARWQDEARWTKNTALNTPRARVDAIKEYLTRRVRFLDSIWIENVPYHTVRVLRSELGERTLFYSIPQGGMLPAAEIGTAGQTARVFEGYFYAGTNTPYDDTRSITEDITLEARWGESALPRDRVRPYMDAIYAIIPAGLAAILLLLFIWEIKRNGAARGGGKAEKNIHG